MNQKGFTLFSVLAGFILLPAVVLGISSVSSYAKRIMGELFIDSEIESTLSTASGHLLQIGRLAQSCTRDSLTQIRCTIKRNGLETIRFRFEQPSSTLHVLREEMGTLIPEAEYRRITSFSVCDAEDLKWDALRPQDGRCPLQDKAFHQLYAKTHPKVSVGFFRFRIESQKQPMAPIRSSQGSFFVRNSADYPDGVRYVWGWSDG